MTTEEKIQALEKQKQQVTDVFYSQQQIVDSLTQLLAQRTAERESTTYVQSVPVEKSPNYLLYALIGLFAFLLLR
jgi:hypothetical protein